jgi:hypothetical protein
VVRIVQDQKRFIVDWFPNGIHIVQRPAVKQHAQAADPSSVPFLLAHFLPVRPEPQDIPIRTAVHHPFECFGFNPPVLKKFSAMQIRMILTQLN